MAVEMGKPLKEGIAEAEKCASVCTYYAKNAETFLRDQLIETDASRSFVTFQPIGIVLAVMPWNFPLWQVFRFLAPALAAGNCGVLKHASNVPGCALAIEDILKELGKDVRLARDGANQWSVKEGSAKINISYNPDNFFIAGDAYLCQMPPEPARIKPLYQFLLQENNKPTGLVLSCQKNNIVLSRLLYDLDMTKESGVQEFKALFQQADHYDDYLKNEFGCTSRLEE